MENQLKTKIIVTLDNFYSCGFRHILINQSHPNNYIIQSIIRSTWTMQFNDYLPQECLFYESNEDSRLASNRKTHFGPWMDANQDIKIKYQKNYFFDPQPQSEILHSSQKQVLFTNKVLNKKIKTKQSDSNDISFEKCQQRNLETISYQDTPFILNIRQTPKIRLLMDVKKSHKLQLGINLRSSSLCKTKHKTTISQRSREVSTIIQSQIDEFNHSKVAQTLRQIRHSKPKIIPEFSLASVVKILKRDSILTQIDQSQLFSPIGHNTVCYNTKQFPNISGTQDKREYQSALERMVIRKHQNASIVSPKFEDINKNKKDKNTSLKGDQFLKVFLDFKGGDRQHSKHIKIKK